MSISQKDGVYNAVVAFMEENERSFEDNMKVELGTEDRKTVVVMLVEATEAGELTVRSEKASADLPKYWEGTLSNWLRKDERLNGGVDYEPKNPGSRSGSGDGELRELKKLLTQVKLTGNEENIKAVQKHVDARVKLIEEKKAEKLKVDLTKIDPELLKTLGFVKVDDVS